MNILVISLEKAKERRESIKKQFESLNIPFFLMDAYDADKLTEAERNKKISLVNGYRFGEQFRPGEIACTMSHIKALMVARDLNWPYVIVLEDDVILAEDFVRRIKILRSILPSDWEHVYLSGIPRLGFNPPPQLQFPNVALTVFTECTHSMIIRDTSYDRIINYLKKFETTTDDSYNQLIMNGLTSYTYYPFCTYANDTYTYIWNHEINRDHKSKLYFKNKL